MITLDNEALALLQKYKDEVKASDEAFVTAITEDTVRTRKRSLAQWERESRAAKHLAEYLSQFSYNNGG
jgi:hypothetical protein